jgi:hypothetical protein
MGSDSDLHALVDEIRQTSGAIERGDSAVKKRVDKLEKSINELYLKTSRPGAQFVADDDDALARKSATEMCRNMSRSLPATRRLPSADHGLDLKNSSNSAAGSGLA